MPYMLSKAHHISTSASPHMLSPALCGHSFCAICGLRWYFSALDVDETGVSHRLLNCPLCKSDLPEFPIFDELRDQWAFPFLPNRLAEDSLDCHFLTFDSAIRSASDLLRSGLRPTQKEHQDHQSNVGLPDLPGLNLGKGVRNWMKGGEDRVRWEKRARLVAHFSRTGCSHFIPQARKGEDGITHQDVGEPPGRRVCRFQGGVGTLGVVS